MPAVATLAAGSRLTVPRIVFAFGQAPAAKLRQTVAQTLTNNTPTALTLNVEDLDTDPDGIGGHSTSSNTSRYTARYPGWYRVGGGVSFVSNSTGVRLASWAVNGTNVAGSDVLSTAVSGNTTRMAARGDLIYLAEGDYLELRVYQSSGGNLDTRVTNDEMSTVSITWERP
ncbi:hypothetical protein [Micromonospora sp. NPDC005174]|uniref:hypothetical protein n=1 Tax=Micromonospora sp. NPDC005174 TaxID=3157018 RepID=UPI0033A8841C